MKTTNEIVTPIEETKVSKAPQTPQGSDNKETKYCTLLQSVKMEDKENGYTYAMEKIHIKDLGRDEIRLCLYKDMRDRSGSISNRMLVRPLDLTEQELIQLLEKAIVTENPLFSTEFLKYLKNIVNQK